MILRKYLIRIVRYKKNKNFVLDEDISTYMLVSLASRMLISLVRSLKLLLWLQFPRFVFLGKSVTFYNLPRIEIGKWVFIEEHVFLSALGKGNIRIGDGTKIGAYSRLIISTSFNNLGEHIHIGNHVGLGEFSRLGGSGGLTIGDDTIIGQYFSVHPENHNFESNSVLIREQGTTRAAISIGHNCWIGSKVTVLAGVDIGNNCIIGAGSVVTKSIPDDSIAVGNPAKIIKNRLEVESIYGA